MRIRFSLLCGKPVIRNRAGFVLRHALAVHIAVSKVVLRFRKPLFRRKTVVLKSLFHILFKANTELVIITE